MNRLFTFLLGFAIAISPLYAYDFETVPQQLKIRGRGTVSLDGNRFKDGERSLRFSWAGQAELLLVDPAGIGAFMDSRKGGVKLWICNETPLSEPLRVSFRAADGKDICWFEFGMQFTGWRAAWVRYEDMHTPDGGYIGDIPLKDRRKDGVMMVIRPSARVVEGSFCLDRLRFTEQAIHHQNTPDAQIPDNNHFLTRRALWHWARLQEWEGYPALMPAASCDEASLHLFSEHLDAFFLDEMPSGRDYAPVAFRPALEKEWEKLHLTRLPDGTPRGTPVVSDDESTAQDIRMQKAFDVLYREALDYKLTGDATARERFFLVADHLLWQGIDAGSGMGTNHHYGYQIRGWANALWLLRKEIRDAGKMEAYRSALAYWAGEAECRLPYEESRDEIIDSWNTLLLPKMVACMLQDTPELQQSHMNALTRWMEGSMRYSHGTLGGIKVDGTTFHHGGHYPAYAEGAYSTLGTYFRLVEGTCFTPSADARSCVKKGLLSLRASCNLYDWGIGISGRHPFGGQIPYKVRNTYGYLAMLGDLTGSGSPYDPELGGAFLHLRGGDKRVAAALKKAGIKPLPVPEGFYAYNYGAYGIHRRGGWMVTLKAFNSDVWGSEIYLRDNRYGRYQSYGSVQIINKGNPASAQDSRYQEAGWDWNRLPGTTTIHLPWDKLNSPVKGTLMERNTSRFPGVSSLEGRNGVLAFTYVEKDRENFCAGATATKSVFCFDNRLVFVGTGISNNSTYPTETTLFQQHLSVDGEAVLVNGNLVNGFPQTWRPIVAEQQVVEDLKGNCYILPKDAPLVIYRQHQRSPENTGVKQPGEGDFVCAVLDHGVAPQDASYEYLLLVEPSSAERKKWSQKRPYEVLQADNRAHAVKDQPTGITAVVSYKGYEDDRWKLPAETILMERTEGDSRIISVCTPDLGLKQKTYTTPQPSQPLQRIVRLKGAWDLASPYEDSVFGTAVQLSREGDSTVIRVTCRHGHPVEFRICLKN